MLSEHDQMLEADTLHLEQKALWSAQLTNSVLAYCSQAVTRKQLDYLQKTIFYKISRSKWVKNNGWACNIFWKGWSLHLSIVWETADHIIVASEMGKVFICINDFLFHLSGLGSSFLWTFLFWSLISFNFVFNFFLEGPPPPTCFHSLYSNMILPPSPNFKLS